MRKIDFDSIILSIFLWILPIIYILSIGNKRSDDAASQAGENFCSIEFECFAKISSNNLLIVAFLIIGFLMFGLINVAIAFMNAPAFAFAFSTASTLWGKSEFYDISIYIALELFAYIIATSVSLTCVRTTLNHWGEIKLGNSDNVVSALIRKPNLYLSVLAMFSCLLGSIKEARLIGGAIL